MKRGLILQALMAFAGFGQSNVIAIGEPRAVVTRSSQTLEITLPVKLAANYHVNSDQPEDPFLIPLKLTWTPGPLNAVQVFYPKAKKEQLKFSSSPVSVFTGEFQISTRFKVAADATGVGVVRGKLRYQACTDGSCLPPKTIDIEAPYEIRK